MAARGSQLQDGEYEAKGKPAALGLSALERRL
jgi:hypothetical protein